MDYRFAACRAAEDLGFWVIRNPENSGITQRSFDNTLKQKQPVFILLLGRENSDKVFQECKLALEYGLPMFAFLKTVYEGNAKLIDDNTAAIIEKISKITYDGDCTVFTSCEELYQQVKSRLNAHIEKQMNLRPVIQTNRGSTYYYAGDQILAAKKRVILSQKTSLLLLGPRKGNSYEHKTYRALLDWIEKKDEDMQFLHLFCEADTKSEMNSLEYDIGLARATLDRLLTAEKNKHGGRDHHNLSFRIIPETKRNVANLITDTGVQLVFSIADNTFNMVLPYYFTPEEELMKMISYIQTRPYVTYSNVMEMYP